MPYRDRTLPAKKLTHRAVQTVDPKGDRVTLPDTEVRGLQYRATRKGEGAFVLKYKDQGKHRRTTLGKFPEMGVAEARKAAMKVKGGDVPEPAPAPTPDQCIELSENTFAVVVERYLRTYAEPNQKSHRETRRVLEYAVPVLGDKPITEISKSDVSDLLEHVLKHGAPNPKKKKETETGRTFGVQANRLHAHLRGLFGWAFDKDLIQIMPMPLKKPAKETPRARVLSDDELAKVIEVVNALDWPNGPFYKTLALTGARLGEVQHMKWSDLDLGEHPVWTINAADNKTGEGQRFPLSSAAAATLREAKAITGEGEYVFTTYYRGDKPVADFTKAKRLIDDKSGVTGWTNHDLRRTMRTWMGQQRSINYAVAERCLGHKLGGIERVYNLADLQDQMREAFAAWGQHVMGLIEPERRAANVVTLR